MVSNKLPVALLAAACILAAGVGGYLATRQNAVPSPAAAMAPVAAPATRLPATNTVSTPVAVVPQSSRRTSSVKREAPSLAPSLTQRSEARRQNPPPAVDRGEPTSPAPVQQALSSSGLTTGTYGSVVGQATGPTGSTADSGQVVRGEERSAPESPRASEPPQHTFEELVVSADSVLGLQTENRLSSETARVEDRIDARVTRDVKVGEKVAIPAGSRVLGSVILVERGGKFRERARLGIQFHTLVLADGTRLPIRTEAVYRDGESPANSSAARVGGGAIGGAILGAILGGAKGAAIGATAGAGGGAAMVTQGDRTPATLPGGTPMTVRVLTPVTVTIDK